MERGGSSNSQNRDVTRVLNSDIVIQEPNAIADNPIPQQTLRRNSDQYVPIANVTRIMRRTLPAHARIADDAKETVQEYVSEFINFITTEANEKCRSECRKTVSAEDIISALGTLGFDDYVEPLTVFLNKYRSQSIERSAVHHVPIARNNPGFVQLLAAQMAQPPPPPPPSTTMGYAPPMPPMYPRDGGDNAGLSQIGESLLNSLQGGGEGSSSGMEFEHSRELK